MEMDIAGLYPFDKSTARQVGGPQIMALEHQRDEAPALCR